MGFPAANDATGNNESLPWPTSTSGTNTQKVLAVATAADREWWDPYGWCEVPQAEEYVSFSIVDTTLCSCKALSNFDDQILEWIVSIDGGYVVEDQAPTSRKISAVPGGFVIYNITGLRVQAAARVDRTGYDVSKSTFGSGFRLQLCC
jgi:hypothetical protein